MSKDDALFITATEVKARQRGWSRTLKLCSCGVLYSPRQYPLGCPLYHVGIYDKALIKTELIMKELGMI